MLKLLLARWWQLCCSCYCGPKWYQSCPRYCHFSSLGILLVLSMLNLTAFKISSRRLCYDSTLKRKAIWVHKKKQRSEHSFDIRERIVFIREITICIKAYGTMSRLGRRCHNGKVAFLGRLSYLILWVLGGEIHLSWYRVKNQNKPTATTKTLDSSPDSASYRRG